MPPQKWKPGPPRRHSPGDGRLGIFLLVTPRQVSPHMAGAHLARLLGSNPSLVSKELQSLRQVLAVRLDGVNRGVFFQRQMPEKFRQGFIHESTPRSAPRRGLTDKA